VLSGEADSPRSGATGERGAGREPRRLSGSLPGGAAGAQAPHKISRFLVIKGEADGLLLSDWNPRTRRTPAAPRVDPRCRCGTAVPAPAMMRLVKSSFAEALSESTRARPSHGLSTVRRPAFGAPSRPGPLLATHLGDAPFPCFFDFPLFVVGEDLLWRAVLLRRVLDSPRWAILLG